MLRGARFIGWGTHVERFGVIIVINIVGNDTIEQVPDGARRAQFALCARGVVCCVCFSCSAHNIEPLCLRTCVGI